MEIKVVSSILKANDQIAEENKRSFRQNGIVVINVMGSPGAGKTSLLLRTIKGIGKQFGIGVIEGDIATTHDAELIKETGVDVVQVNTDGACHLDAAMVKCALAHMNLSKIDLLFIENVGNLVCPATFKLGEEYRVVVLSIPEGDDKIRKYPTIFKRVDAILLNKMDTLNSFEFDLETFRQDAYSINENMLLFEISCKDGTGFTKWFNWMEKIVKGCRLVRG
jgi:hydrogenase nickel incorporation protein HypB